MDLALKYRPKTFDDVVGQNFITEILSRQIKTNTQKNAYLFCGAYGCGKTTCARIFANELNHGEADPIEIDGASNNGVENIRALINDAQQSAVDADYKVYIIDEAHMITTQGWNAALKLIEEPPLHCVFIFCTTNPEKMPSTILSRVQRFDFKKVSIKLISDRLEYIIKHEGGIIYDKNALDRIAVLSDGHLRNAIKILDTCLDVDKNISLELVESLFGLVKQETVNKIVIGLINKDLNGCINEYNHSKSASFDGVKLYDAVLNEALRSLINIKTNDMNTYILSNTLKTQNAAFVANALKTIVDNMYENRKFMSAENADTITQYIFVRCCQ